MEYRRRCRVCGKVWCYTDEDLRRNRSNAVSSAFAAIGGIASAVGGTTAQQHLSYDMMERTSSKVVDYDQCPSCHSKSTSIISEEEWQELQLKEQFANTHVSINANATTESILKRAEMFLQDGDWPNANAYADSVLDTEPDNAHAYTYKLMAELRVSQMSGLGKLTTPFEDRPNYVKAVKYADKELAAKLTGYNDGIKNEILRVKEEHYAKGVAIMNVAQGEMAFRNAAVEFANCGNYKDANDRYARCMQMANELKNKALQEKREAKQAQTKAAVKKTGNVIGTVINSIVFAILLLIAVAGLVVYLSGNGEAVDVYFVTGFIIAAILAFPYFGKLLSKMKGGKALRVLRWVLVVVVIIALSVMAV